MIIKLGDKGKNVRELQQLLGLKVDGDFGPITDKSVRNFQKNNGLKVDGLVGNKTWTMLLKQHENKVKPLNNVNYTEDFSDPEDEITVDNIKENCPTCSNLIELIKLVNESKITRNIKRIIFHCTATSQSATVTSIQNYWKNKLGWKSPGYHIIVLPNGDWVYLQNFNLISNGVSGYNSTSINISYIGGVEGGKAKDNRTPEQIETFKTLYELFKEKIPTVTFHGHNEFSNKACPSYNVKEELKKWTN